MGRARCPNVALYPHSTPAQIYRSSPVSYFECLATNGSGVAIVDPLSALDTWRAGGIALARFEADVPFVVDTEVPAGLATSVLAEQFLDTVKGTLKRPLQEVTNTREARCDGPVSP